MDLTGLKWCKNVKNHQGTDKDWAYNTESTSSIFHLNWKSIYTKTSYFLINAWSDRKS